MARSPSFLIVGTPRSGTTLVQRLACELPGVRMPHETHFFSVYAPGLLRRRRFPLTGATLREELETWAANKSLGETRIDVGPVLDRLGGSAASLWDMFSAIVVELAGDGDLIGEKTPRHLLWWRPLTRRVPDLKVVVVVRDPRGAVASMQRVPFGVSGHVLQAEGWRADQRLVRQARTELGSDRLLVLRYEEVVADPDRARDALASFLGRPPRRESPSVEVPADMYLPWEKWKQRVSEAVTSERIDAWREELSLDQTADVTAICRTEMGRFGYADGIPTTGEALRRVSLIPPASQWRRFRFRTGRRIRLAWLDSAAVRRALGSDVSSADHVQGASA